MSATAQKQEKTSQREEQKMKGVKKNNSVLVPLGTETVQAHTDDTVSNDVVAEQQERDVVAAAAEEAAAGEEERKAGVGDGDDGEEEEEEDEEQEVDDDDDDDQIDAEPEKPKLPEGFYELEAVRKRRTRKGLPQYLIKWKGWPESANTWEPMENLMACTEVIAAFDKSFKSPKGGSKRKRKQKRKAPRTQIKRKKQQCSPGAHTYDVQTVQVPIFEEPMPSPPLAGLDDTNHVDSNGGDLNNIIDNNVMDDNVSKLDSSLEEIKEPSELDLNVSELNGVTEINESCVDNLGDGLTNGSVQSGRCTGAKKRKSYCVRRFRLETASGERDDAQDGAASAASTPSIKIVQEGVHNFECVENDLGCRIKCDDSKDEYTITHIIKPMSYSPFVSNDVEDVLVTFLAKRSDGKNVTVDSMYLKRTNPLLLANFYEQHLRFNPSVELDAMKKE